MNVCVYYEVDSTCDEQRDESVADEYHESCEKCV